MSRVRVSAAVAVLGVLAGCGGAADDGSVRTVGGPAAAPPIERPAGVHPKDAALAAVGLQRLDDLPEGWEQGRGGRTGTGENPAAGGACPVVRRAWRSATVWRAAGTLVVDARYDLDRVLGQVVVVYPSARAAQRAVAAFVSPGTRGCVTAQVRGSFDQLQADAEYGTRLTDPQVAVVHPPTTGDAVGSYRVRGTVTWRGSVLPVRIGVDHTRVGRVVLELTGSGTDDTELKQANAAAVARLVAAGARGPATPAG